MTDTKDNGGPAFPTSCDLRHMEAEGMTLRQYAAIKFIAAEISREGMEGGDVIKIVAMAQEYVDEFLEPRRLGRAGK